jgi:peptidoglycan/xylan/chitin deacetylase (PgdA/CDA1 family)
MFFTKLILTAAILFYGADSAPTNTLFSSLVKKYPVNKGNGGLPVLPEWRTLLQKNALPSSAVPTQPLQNCQKPNTWALTFDDGPSLAYTTSVLASLKKANVKAIFFVIGKNVLQSQKSVDILRQTYADGHQIGIHTWSHPDLQSISNEQVVAELMWTGKLIEEILGVFPVYMRPPFGSVNVNVLKTIQSVGLVPVKWNLDSFDWAIGSTLGFDTGCPFPNKPNWNEANSKDCLLTGLNKAKTQGVISLEHDTNPYVISVVPNVLIPAIKKSNIITVQLQQCLNGPASYYAIGKSPINLCTSTTNCSFKAPNYFPSSCKKGYSVKSGDTCSAIAGQNGISLVKLLSLNPGIGCNNLQIGQSVCVA